jgi:hypothetical protein
VIASSIEFSCGGVARHVGDLQHLQFRDARLHPAAPLMLLVWPEDPSKTKHPPVRHAPFQLGPPLLRNCYSEDVFILTAGNADLSEPP